MTKKPLSKKFRTLIALLSVLFVFCTCAFAVACNNSSDSSDDSSTKTYSYTETDTKIISNANFVYGTHDKTASDFPITSPTGWTRSADNSATTSNVNSGVVSVSSAAWDKLFDTLYEDSDFVKYYEYKFKADLEGKTDEEKKAFIKEKYANPETHADAPDNFVYMLNNYSSVLGKGTAQRVASSSTVSVKKGEVYKISVWVKTLAQNTKGANIRFTTSINNNSQAEFRIDNIKNTDWTEYTVYFVANGDYDCTFRVMLGLGYGNGKSTYTEDYAEGTVFFDDVKAEKIEAADMPAAFDGTKTLVFGSEDALSVSPTGNNVFKFDMNFDTTAYFTKAVALTSVTGALTTSNAGIAQTGTGSYDNTTGVATVNKASYTLTVKDGTNNFKITTADEDDYEKYMLVSFKLKNELNKLGSTDITVNVVDIYNDEPNPTNGKAVATFSTVATDDEYTTCYILVKNDFRNQPREFYLELVIGPTDIKSVTAAADYASGTVTIKDIKAAEGYISSEQYPDKEDDLQYKLYSFFSSGANATVALYAGYNADYAEQHDTATYSLTPAKGNVGQILTQPTAVNGYSGIVSNHVYVKGEEHGDDLETKINDRLNLDGAKGYAGLINTKYLVSYETGDNNLPAILAGLYTADKNIQPIVINNKTADHYGFIGAQQTVAASSYAKVTVKIKVFDDAKAYVYLVDTSKAEKEVLEFANFTVNTTDGLKNGAINGTTYSAADHKFMLTVDKNATVGDDGFVEVTFYIATGTDAKSFRVEVWNGGRDGATETASQGYVVINSIEVVTSSAFTEPTSWQTAFDTTGNPLFDATIGGFNANGNELIAYLRELTETEKKFNKEYPDKAISYKSSYVWASNDTTIYAVFNTVNPVEKNPYDDIDPEEKGSGCKTSSDPSTFWLSFSSITLAVVLVLAIAALFIKRFRARRKANKSDVKAQYKVKSRTESQKAINKAKEQKAAKSAVLPDADTNAQTEETDGQTEIAQDVNTDAEAAENVTETNETAEEGKTENTESGDNTEQSGYVYGDVQDFGDMSFEMPEENKAETPATDDGENKE